MIRTKGEPGTGDVVQAVRHMRMMNQEIAKITSMREDELYDEAKNLQVPYDLVQYVHDNGRIPVVNFAAGGVATPAKAVTNYTDADMIAKLSEDLGEAMVGINEQEIELLMAERGK